VDRRKFIKAAAAETVAIAAAAARGDAQTGAGARTNSVPIIDTHVHLYDPSRPQGVPWPSPEQASIYRTFLPADYRRIAEPFGVVGMIETECSPWVEDNYWVLDVSAKETIVVGEIGDLFPGKPDFGEHLSLLHKNPLYRGIRFAYLWGRDVGAEIKKPQVMSDLKLLSDAGLSLDSGGTQKDIPNLLRITDRIPNLRIVINHLPGAPIPDEPAARVAYQHGLRELGKRPQVYVKVSEIFQRVDEKGRRVDSGGRIPRDLNFYRPRLDEIRETFGPDRLLFASDWTNSEPMGTFGETLRLVQEYFTPKGPEAAEKFFWKNSVAAYRWVKRRATQPGLA
jgi:predicted TIM-barrel fold metal-dependent hydrolase